MDSEFSISAVLELSSLVVDPGSMLSSSGKSSSFERLGVFSWIVDVIDIGSVSVAGEIEIVVVVDCQGEIEIVENVDKGWREAEAETASACLKLSGTEAEELEEEDFEEESDGLTILSPERWSTLSPEGSSSPCPGGRSASFAADPESPLSFDGIQLKRVEVRTEGDGYANP